MQHITITTDFGDRFATSQLHAVVRSLAYTGHLVENHDVHPYSILEGAYGMWQLAKFCEPDTVHVGVIDPGVGTKRAGIVIRTERFWFVGPDNGLLYPAAAHDRIQAVWKLHEPAFGEVAQTFHGRDVFIKAAVYLAQGKIPETFGSTLYTEPLQQLLFTHGQIVHIDRYGNAKFVWHTPVKPGDFVLGIPVVHTFSDVGIGQTLVLYGSSQLLELAVNQGSAHEKFALQLGQILCQSFT